MNSKTASRQSGIELLKIISCFLIMINHVTQSATQTSSYLPEYAGKMINLWVGSVSLPLVILRIFRNFGCLGDIVFLVCSVWFLCDSPKEKYNPEKCIKLCIDRWIILNFVLLMSLLFREAIDGEIIIKTVFCDFFCVNWYVSCYIIIYLIHPLLNLVILNLDHKNFTVVTAFCLLFIISNWICRSFTGSGTFFYSDLIFFVTMYFFVAYIKKYCQSIFSNLRYVFLIVGWAGIIGLQFLLNWGAGYINFLSNKPDLIRSMTNPFIISAALGMFFVFKNIRFTNKTVNYIAGTVLYIYLFHENNVTYYYTRTKIWAGIFDRYGYENIVGKVLLFTIILFVISMAFSIIYTMTVKKGVSKISDKIWGKIIKIYTKKN